MAAAIVVRSDAARDGPQPFDPGRHMRQVAQLVRAVFADELDERGRNALREMEFAGRLSPFLGDLTSLALFDETFCGQVWMADGRVIGNVSLQAADGAGLRWRITNVAVLPEYRGRGIARSLMQETLREIARRGGAWALLQVRALNATAYHLYESLGFTYVCREAIWQLSTPPAHAPRPDPRTPLEPLRSVTGEEWLELARAARPALAQWAEPLNPAAYRLTAGRRLGELLGRWMRYYVVERWAAWEQGRLMGVVESRADAFGGTDRLHFAVRPEARGRLESVLVAQGLRSLAEPGWRPIVVEHSGDHVEGVAALEAAGFQVQRDLITMRRQIMPEDKR